MFFSSSSSVYSSKYTLDICASEKAKGNEIRQTENKPHAIGAVDSEGACSNSPFLSLAGLERERGGKDNLLIELMLCRNLIKEHK